MWFDIFLRVYLESVYHEENQIFGMSNILDMMRALLGSIVRDLRVIEEKKNKQHSEEIPLDLISKFNSLFDFYFSGKLPDELNYMTLDQKDILKPLLATVYDYCISKLELFQELCQGYEELIVCETYMLISNSLLFKHQTGQRLHGLSADEDLQVTVTVNQMIEKRLMLSLSSDLRHLSTRFVRFCLSFVLKVVLNSRGSKTRRPGRLSVQRCVARHSGLLSKTLQQVRRAGE